MLRYTMVVDYAPDDHNLRIKETPLFLFHSRLQYTTLHLFVLSKILIVVVFILRHWVTIKKRSTQSRNKWLTTLKKHCCKTKTHSTGWQRRRKTLKTGKKARRKTTRTRKFVNTIRATTAQLHLRPHLIHHPSSSSFYTSNLSSFTPL